MSTTSPLVAAAHMVLQDPLIGSFISLILYGISCVQTFFYFQTYPDDRVWFKCFVVFLWILESAHSGFTIAFNNSYLINGFGDLVAVNHIPWEFVVTCEIGFLVTLTVNILFTWRVWTFSRKGWATLLFLVLSLARYGLATVSIAFGFIDTTWVSFKDRAYTFIAIALGLAFLEDTLFALILAYYLYSMRTERSTHLITGLLAYVVGTGALTSVISVMELVFILAIPNRMFFVPFALVQVKIYANSALLSLNLRQYQRKTFQEVVPLSDFHVTSDRRKSSKSAKCFTP